MKSVLTAPRGLMLVSGQLVLRGTGITHWSQPLICRQGHVMQEHSSQVEGVDIPRCPACDFGIYIVSMHAGYQFRADLTAEEAHEIRMKRSAWRIGDVMRYVGAELGERVA